MSRDIVAALPLRPHVVRVVFADGQVRDADIEPLLDGPIFRPLRDQDAFEQVFGDQKTHTVAWPNGADLDPDVLYEAGSPASPEAARVSVPQSV
jgi:hypothetical protein